MFYSSQTALAKTETALANSHVRRWPPKAGHKAGHLMLVALKSDPDLYVIVASPPSAPSYGCEESL